MFTGTSKQLTILHLALLASIGAIACEQLEAPPETPQVDGAASAMWQTVWFDDFDGTGLDPENWAPEVSCWGGGNNERQCYTGREANVEVEDGILLLKAREEAFTGPLFPEGMQGAPGGERTQSYTSGKIRSKGLASWRYGRFSARLKLPEGQGTWPAFWMMPEDDAYGGWPLSGEIDIMEATNLETPCEECFSGVERRTSGALHFGGVIPDNTYLFLTTKGDEDVGPSREWRVYSIEWAEDAIQWFVDGEAFMRIESEDWYTEAPGAEGRPHAPFDQPFYLMLNLAVGGNLAEQKNGRGFDPGAFPAELLVDWVKVEQCEGDDTGRSCMTQTGWTGTPQGPWETQAR
ncbi:MAG: glycoside hydrolase family 16 protein [Pseudomonadota bacterium]